MSEDAHAGGFAGAEFLEGFALAHEEEVRFQVERRVSRGFGEAWCCREFRGEANLELNLSLDGASFCDGSTVWVEIRLWGLTLCLARLFWTGSLRSLRLCAV